ncbi:hypothetical protein LguiB_001988 [Lonicera macranthoides]
MLDMSGNSIVLVLSSIEIVGKVPLNLKSLIYASWLFSILLASMIGVSDSIGLTHGIG